jgi:UDP-N-acetylmuramate: L-alanyl-gamma-D-glutamyl-meso-diaminopimelate ligase
MHGLDPALNRIPDQVRKIHLMAMCGTGMGALASILQDLGYAVTGSDQHVYPPMSEFLRARGIVLSEGYNPIHLSYGPDLVVVGNAITKANPEVAQLRGMRLNYCSMPQAVNHFVAGDKQQIVITGTHGKTTTASLVAWLLQAAGQDPSFMIGGILANFDSNYRYGQGPAIVIEGDEYDTAFFDKGPKFLHYPPTIAIMTSVEFDHADIFRDLAHVVSAFDQFLDRISAKASLLAYDNDARIAQLVQGRACRHLAYGRKPDSAWRLERVQLKPPWTIFDVVKQGHAWGRFRTRLCGVHNLYNILAAIAAVETFGVTPEAVAEGLAAFKGIKRRQEIRGIQNGITVIDDFAHHPTAVRETIRGLKPFYPQGRLIAVFEPRTNSSRRKVFQEVYPTVFDEADVICIRRPPLREGIPEAERFSSEQLVEDLSARGKAAYAFPDTDRIIAFLAAAAQPGDAILIMSNGGFDNIHQRLLEVL